jgi:UDP-3-O-[3-hydroxymyristoyl] glucosamine N-acyltransferase
MAQITIGEIAAAIGGELVGDPEVVITGVAPLETAQPQDLTFVANPRYLPYLQATRAGAVLVPRDLAESAPQAVVRVLVGDPHIAMYHALRLLYPAERRLAAVHPTAVVDPTARLGAEVSVGPYAVIGARVRIGDGSSIGAQTVIGDDCQIGAGCTIHPHATLHHGVVLGARCVIHSGARLGREGFGFVWLDGAHTRVPQVGGCILGDEVEIGANSTVDRGSIGDTVVGSGTKIDSLVHLGHNVKVGRHVVMIAQVGVSGSTSVGDGAILAGQAGVGGHLSIGAGARIGGQAGVTADVPAGQTYSGYPARPHREAMRAQAAVFKLPDLLKRIREIERALLGRAAASRGEADSPTEKAADE